MRYRAFISHSQQDARWARWIYNKLEHYRVPTRLRGSEGEYGPLPTGLSPVFYARRTQDSRNLSPKIEAALEASEALVVVCSPDAARSPSVNRDVLAFKRMGRSHRIYCLIVDGEPHAGDEQECFPPAVHLDLDADGTLGTRLAKPMAADVRPGAEGKRTARMKLLSGLLGVDLNILRRHDAARRQRRLLAVASLAVTVSLLTSTLAIHSLIGRHAAERRQQQAETLVGFMLNDFTDKLAHISRLDIMASVNDEATTYFSALPGTEGSTQSLQRRAHLLEKIGTVRRDQADLNGALQSYRAAQTLAAHLASAAPENLHRQLDAAKTLSLIGGIHWQQDQLDQAEADFTAAKQVLAKVPIKQALNPSVLYQRSALDDSLGQVREARGHLEQALANYRDMLVLSKQLAQVDPSNRSWGLQSGLAHNNLGRMAVMRGDLANAVNHYQANLDIQLDLAMREPQDNDQAQRLARARAALGRTLALTGAVEPGIGKLRRSLATITLLRLVDPQNAAAQEDEGMYSLELAYWLRTSGDLNGANLATEHGLAVFEQLTRQAPTNPSWQRALALARIEQAEQANGQGERMTTRDHLHAAMHMLELQLAAQPHERDTLLAKMRTGLLLANVSDDPTIATKLRQQALAEARAPGGGRGDPRLLAFQAQALLELGQVEEARAVLPILWQTGFRDPRFMALMRSQRLPGPVAALTKTKPHHAIPY